MPSQLLTKVHREGRRYYVRFGKVELEFNDRQHLLLWLDGPLDVTTDEGLRRMMLKRWHRANPALDNPALVEGKRVTYDPSADSVEVR